jgi:HTH-type transcriptional regulator / antitoxin HigA
MEIRVIKDAAQYHSTLSEVERLVALDPGVGSYDADRLELLSVLIEDFEKRNFPIDSPDPIEAIEFRMQEQGLRQIDLASLVGSRSRVSEVLSRKRPLTVAMIRSLSKGLGIPVDVLLSERNAKSSLESEADPVKYDWDKFPIREMARRGWIDVEMPSRITASVKKQAEESLKSFLGTVFSNVATPMLYRRTFRGETLDEKAFYSTLAWSARVLSRTKESETKYKKFDPSTLDEEFFSQVARLSRLVDGPRQAIEILAAKGIALVIEPKLPNTLIDGASIMSESGIPVIGMTLRYGRVDYFWFTLLHELAHIWKHLSSADEAFIDRIESNSPTAVLEKQANRIAREAMIPRAVWKRSQAFLHPSRETIEQLADELSIHPAIVAGRLQYESGKYEVFRDIVDQDSVRALFPQSTFG